MRVPVVQALPNELVADCPPSFEYDPARPVTVRDLVDRLDAVEDALAICRRNLALLRELPRVEE